MVILKKLGFNKERTTESCFDYANFKIFVSRLINGKKILPELTALSSLHISATLTFFENWQLLNNGSIILPFNKTLPTKIIQIHRIFEIRLNNGN